MRTAKWKVAVIENRVDKKIVVFASLMVSAQQQKEISSIARENKSAAKHVSFSAALCLVLFARRNVHHRRTTIRKQRGGNEDKKTVFSA